MLSIGREAISINAGDSKSAHFFVLRGRAEILRLRSVLTTLSELCGQAGAMDYLDYFLTTTEDLKKTPVSCADGVEVRCGCVRASAPKICAAPSWCTSTRCWDSGPGSSLHAISMDAGQSLRRPSCAHRSLPRSADSLWRRARKWCSSVSSRDLRKSCQTCFEAAMEGERKRWWTTQTREVRRHPRSTEDAE